MTIHQQHNSGILETRSGAAWMNLDIPMPLLNLDGTVRRISAFERAKMKRWLTLITGVAILVGSNAAALQDEACFAGGFDSGNGNCDYHGEVAIEMIYPAWVNDYAFAREVVADYLLDLRETFWQAAYESRNRLTERRFLFISYSETLFGTDVRSLQFTVDHFIGSDHRETDFRTFVFDLAREQHITLDDLFTDMGAALAVVAPLVEQKLLDDIDPQYIDPEQIAFGTGTNPDNYQRFFLNDEAVIFIFPRGQVAAPAAGSFHIWIEWDDITAVLAPAFRDVP